MAKAKSRYQKPKGTADILPGDSELWQKVEAVARETFHQYGYSEIRTPMFEEFNVYSRNVGETSDIVTKEMYDFDDKGGRHIALRPEGTAGVVRSYVENKLFGPEYPKPYKMFYIGPMFRYERPQSGRQRQFTQIGCEALNSESPQIDAEVILEALTFFKRLGINNLRVAINTLGDRESREAYHAALVNYLTPYKDELSADSQTRLEKNPLRVLDSKDERDQAIVANAPSIMDSLNEYSANYFAQVKSLLDDFEIDYVVDPTMVRGLDYYTHTIFEIMSDSKAFGGGYVTVCGGGRYNGLIGQLGGPEEEGGIGYGLGFERLLLLLEEENPAFIPQPSLDLFFVSANQAGDQYAFKLMQKLREQGLAVDKDYQGIKLGKQIKEAERKNSRYFVVVGDREVETEELEIKSVTDNQRQRVQVKDLLDDPEKYLK
ncbi:histidine--tRNA ligase [Limosilactobacillus gastricus]|uniref:histidine--tRNA ligase n=1 Tax=Limosilactobacillus gastricus TaxID=227942 RepID=UPI0026EBC38D|nr:histidine--tRNA ligase [Limosilactobacillus gastricus]